MRISDWSSDVCSSDLVLQAGHEAGLVAALQEGTVHLVRVAEAGHLAELLGLARRQGSRLADHPALVVAVLRLARPPGEHAGGGHLPGEAVEVLEVLRLAVQIGRASCRERVGQYG